MIPSSPVPIEIGRELAAARRAARRRRARLEARRLDRARRAAADERLDPDGNPAPECPECGAPRGAQCAEGCPGRR